MEQVIKQSNVTHSINFQDIVLNDNLELWMTKLPPYLKRVPIIHLAIPGSHNTMTYTINRFNDVGPDEPRYLRFLGRYCSIITKPLIFNWSVTQYDDIIQQLNGGIRYLDLRLSSKAPNNEDIYFLHGLYGDEVTLHLRKISKWLMEHPEEILIMDFQHFYSFTINTHRNLVSKIKSIFGSKICPPFGGLSSVNIEWLLRRKYQLIIIYRNEIAKVERDLWPSGLWPTPWPDTTNTNELIDFLDTRLNTRLPGIGFISQCLLTPDTAYVLKHICGSLHTDLSRKCEKITLNWIEKHHPGSGGMNIVITDYVSFNNFQFSKIVIQRNCELLRNESLAELGVYLREKSSKKF